MGVVYLAEDERLHRKVALKVLGRAEDDARRQRFLREARAAAAVTHPNIAAIHEVGEAGGVSFIAMQLVQGRTLRDFLIERIGRREPVPLPEVLRIAGEVARGLTRAHKEGIVHRDLKPENVMIGDDDRVVLLDFGIAKRLGLADGATPGGSDLAAPADAATVDGSILGTPGYMSPEQSSGSPVDSRTDVFAFGVMLYELLTGTRPFTGASLRDVLLATRGEGVAPPSQQRPDTPPELERIVLRCLEKIPDARYRDGAEILDDLDRLARPAPPAEAPLPLPREGLLRRGLVMSAVHFPTFARVAALGVSPVLLLVLARHVLLRFLPASAAHVAELILAVVPAAATIFVVASSQSAITACTAWLLANPGRDVRAREAFGALRGKLGALAGAVLLFEALVGALLVVISLAVGTLFGRPLSVETWRVLLGLSPGPVLALTFGGTAVVGPMTVRWCLAASVLALERRGPMAALRRSSELVQRARRSILPTWLALILVYVLPPLVTMVLVGSVMQSPIVSFEGMAEGDLTSTLATVAFCALEAVLLIPFGVALALGYLEALRAGGETLDAGRRSPT
jgi:serine/threonine protein kinase